MIFFQQKNSSYLLLTSINISNKIQFDLFVIRLTVFEIKKSFNTLTCLAD